MSSIVLDSKIKEMLLADCQDFLRSKDWYVSYFGDYLIAIAHGVYRYAEKSEFLSYFARKNAGIYGPVFGKGYPSDVDICCMVYREGIPASKY